VAAITEKERRVSSVNKLGDFMAPFEALKILDDETRPVIVDLDETLFLRNSTEEFLGLARPVLVAEILLRGLDLVRPWRWLGGQTCRDSWRVLFVSVFLPWTLARWRRECALEVPRHVNAPLRDALASAPGPVIIASNGYRRLIRPMLPFLGLPHATLIACELRRLSHRRDGKLALVFSQLESDLIARSIVITDSLDDRNLLDRCAVPCLVKWDGAEFRPAVKNRIYLPGDYLAKVKQPNSFARQRLVKETLAIWLIAALTSEASSPALLAGLMLLFLSFWSAYEAGYHDNDRCAARYEDDPGLTAEAMAFQDPWFEWKAWISAAIFGVGGILLISGWDRPVAFLIWASTLLALRATYWLYNRIDKDTRIWLYLLLQGFRYTAFVGLVAIGPVGWAVCLSTIIPAWMDYVNYRYSRRYGIQSFPTTPTRAYRLAVLCMLLVPIIMLGGFSAIWTLATPVALVWFGLITWRRDWQSLYDRAHRLDRLKANSQ
jgi:hypothetical protein